MKTSLNQLIHPHREIVPKNKIYPWQKFSRSDVVDDQHSLKPAVLERSSSKSLVIKLILQKFSIVISIFLLALSVVLTTQGSTFLTNKLALTIALVIFSVSIFTLAYLIATFKQKTAFQRFAFVVILVAALKILLVSFYTLKPTGQFLNYHNLAFMKASGIAWSAKTVGVNLLWPHVTNVAMMYSIPYTIAGAHYIVAQILSITLTMFDAFMIYKLCDQAFNQTSGIFAGLIFTFIPSYFMYSLLNGDEPLFLTAFLGVLLAFQTFSSISQPEDMAPCFRNLFLLTILTYMIQPKVTVWMFAGLIYLIIKRSPKQFIPKLRLRHYSYYLGFSALFLVFATVSTPVFSQIYKLPFVNQGVNARYSLAIGTNMKSPGEFNTQNTQTLKTTFKNIQAPAQIKTNYVKQLNVQINKNVVDLNHENNWTKLLRSKLAAYTNENYGYNAVYQNTPRSNHFKKTFFDSKAVLSSFSSIFYLAILIVSIVIMSITVIFGEKWHDSQNIFNHVFYASLLINSFIMISWFFSIQSSNHAVLYLPLMIVLASGIYLLTRSRKDNIKIF